MRDRRLIAALFGFPYKGEIHTLPAQRKYGHYVPPLPRGKRLTGRVEAVRKESALAIRNLGLERAAALSPAARRNTEALLHRLARLNARAAGKDETGPLSPGAACRAPQAPEAK